VRLDALDAARFLVAAVLACAPAVRADEARQTTIATRQGPLTVEVLLPPSRAAEAETLLARVEAVVLDWDAALAPDAPAPGPADTRRAQAVERALGICQWSSGALGPFGGEGYRLWGLRGSAAGIPGDEATLAAVAGNRCDLTVDKRAADLGLGALRARLDLFGFVDGTLVDRAVEQLLAAGVSAGRARLGGIVRAFGDGPNLAPGSGWLTFLPRIGTAEAEAVFLKNRALAAIDGQAPLAIGGESFPRVFDLRNGKTITGTLAVLVSTGSAADSESIGRALFALGPREGQFRLGGLSPQPAARWIQGSGVGEPLVVDSRWTAVFGRSRRP
jgi:thiamine biosynthesis lipoprotein ApbE